MKKETKILKNDIDWTAIKNECRTTVNKNGTENEPTEIFKRKLLISEHSPIRIGHILFAWDSIKSWVSVHFARHWLGWDKWVGTQRNDRTDTGIDRNKAPQDTEVMMHVNANPQALINVGRFRLCYGASPETREKMEDLKMTIREDADKYVSDVIVPNCVYRAGCPEFTMCEEKFWIKFLEYCKEHNLPLNTIQQRYDAYNQMFYETHTRDCLKGEIQ